jgi:hypothetical protein
MARIQRSLVVAAVVENTNPEYCHNYIRYIFISAFPQTESTTPENSCTIKLKLYGKEHHTERIFIDNYMYAVDLQETH